MKRDSFGICLSTSILIENLHTTFTHVRAYEAKDAESKDLTVLLSFPQMLGKDLLSTVQGSRQLVWRASHHCRSHCK